MTTSQLCTKVRLRNGIPSLQLGDFTALQKCRSHMSAGVVLLLTFPNQELGRFTIDSARGVYRTVAASAASLTAATSSSGALALTNCKSKIRSALGGSRSPNISAMPSAAVGCT